MTNLASIATSLSRRLHGGLAAAVLALVMGHWSLVIAAPAPAAAAPVVGIASNRVADLVLLGNGSAAGLREGMVCRITRGPLVVAEVQLVGLRPHAAAALILTLASGQAIQPGDLASAKVSKT